MNSHTPRLVNASSKIYRLLLFFYPPSLRHLFGQEMELLFQEQIRDAWEESGYTGLLRSWYRATAELVRIALPARLFRFRSCVHRKEADASRHGQGDRRASPQEGPGVAQAQGLPAPAALLR